MRLGLKVLVAEGGAENYSIYKLLSTQCPKYLSDIIPSSEWFYDTRKKQRPFFNSRIVSNILSFQIPYLNGRNLRLKYKTRSLL